MDDLISRQAAIDALEREKSLVERPITETRWFDFGLRKTQDVLSGLPTAQERKKGDIVETLNEYILDETHIDVVMRIICDIYEKHHPGYKLMYELWRELYII